MKWPDGNCVCWWIYGETTVDDARCQKVEEFLRLMEKRCLIRQRSQRFNVSFCYQFRKFPIYFFRSHAALQPHFFFLFHWHIVRFFLLNPSAILPAAFHLYYRLSVCYKSSLTREKYTIKIRNEIASLSTSSRQYIYNTQSRGLLFLFFSVRSHTRTQWPAKQKLSINYCSFVDERQWKNRRLVEWSWAENMRANSSSFCR